MRYWIDGRVMVKAENAPNSEYAEIEIEDMAQSLVRWCRDSVENASYLYRNPAFAYIKGVQSVHPIATDMQTRGDIISRAKEIIEKSDVFIPAFIPKNSIETPRKGAI